MNHVAVLNHLDHKFSINQSLSKTSTMDIRNLSQEMFREIQHEPVNEIFEFCELLLAKRIWRYGLVAFDWAYRLRKHYCQDTFELFEHWLFDYVSGWMDCDDFCTHALGYLMLDFPEFQDRVLSWVKHPDFWVRRASAVVWIVSIKKNQLDVSVPLLVAESLLHDEHYLVLKGYGWMLKVLSQVNQEVVKEFLLKHKHEMPRLSLRYSLQKMDDQTRKSMMNRT